jgi:hypothetical protein
VIGFVRAETTGFPDTIIPPSSGSPAVSARSVDPGGLGSFAPISAVDSPRPGSCVVGRLARPPLLVPSNWKRAGGDAQTLPTRMYGLAPSVIAEFFVAPAAGRPPRLLGSKWISGWWSRRRMNAFL